MLMGSAFSGSNNGVGDVNTPPGPAQINRAVPGATQLTWDPTKQTFVMAPISSSYPAGCWDIPSASYKPWTSMCNNQVLYTIDGKLPDVGISAEPSNYPLPPNNKFPPPDPAQIGVNPGGTTNQTLLTTGGTPLTSSTQTTMVAPSSDIMFGSFDATQFVSQYWMWLAGGAAALAFLVLKK